MVIKRFSNMLGSRHGANPFSRSRSHDANTEDAQQRDVENFTDDSPEGSAARGVVRTCSPPSCILSTAQG
jgi:hypothetical protein